MTNKELVRKLSRYFETQDPRIVAYLLACSQLDHYRLSVFESLPEEEADCLIERLEKNNQELMKFAKNGPSGKLTFENWNPQSEPHECDCSPERVDKDPNMRF